MLINERGATFNNERRVLKNKYCKKKCKGNEKNK